MPEISKTMLPHWCVVWKKTDTKSKYGQPRLNAPINVKCRWAEDDQYQVSQEVSQEAFPRNIPVNQDIPLGSYVWGEGRIADLPSSPVYLEVISVSRTPDIKGRHSGYRVSLQKASKTLPDLS